jgi:ribosomal-protein-alanine acetyltransferase
LTVEFLIRPMEAGDLDRVVAIAAVLPLAPQWSPILYAEAIVAENLPLRVALVAAGAGEVAGFSVASMVPPESELESIVVAESFQGRGIGQALLGAMLRELERLGAAETILEVRKSNSAAIRLYRRMGFNDAGFRAGYYQSPQEDALVMRLSIRPV